MAQESNGSVDTEDRFAFGKNWSQFAEKHFSEERVRIAKEKLLQSLHLDSLQGMSFLDIGCGSGLNSLVAWQAGAARVFSFDYDMNSVATTLKIRQLFGNPVNWTVAQASVLNHEFMASLDKFDIVYSWGVLHHTGNMWKALENAALPLGDNGVFFIALYSYINYQDAMADGFPSPEQWLKIKQKYNALGNFGKRAYELSYIFKYEIVKDSRNPISIAKNAVHQYRTIKNYSASRGMEYWTDVRDWLGGWPMEFVKEGEIFVFARDRLKLEVLDCVTGEGNTEFIFRRIGSSNYWDEIQAKRVPFIMPASFFHESGHMFGIRLSELAKCANTNAEPKKSKSFLYEDGVPLPYRNAQHGSIRKFGQGRYSHWEDFIYFSTSDNTDPNINGRKYWLMLEET